jgi:hypothetical protein
MIVHHGGVQGDVSTARLPADAYPALFAYSLNRKLRYLYDGEYFDFVDKDGAGSYPNRTPSLEGITRITKIYDQKAKHGVPVQDAVQLVTDLQPRLGYSDNPAGQKEYKAIFNNKEYFDIPNLAPFIGQNFTITAIGDGGDVPRPMIGVWGDNDIITYEPSDLTTRFAFNSNMGSIIQQDGRVTQCFSGYDWTQNYTNVMSVKTAGEKAHRTRGVINPDFTNLSIGRQDQRFYVGEFSEAVMHLDELTSLGSDQLFSTTRTEYGY